MTLRYRISFGPHIVLIKMYLIFIESYLIFPLNIFVFYFFVITVYMLKKPFLLWCIWRPLRLKRHTAVWFSGPAFRATALPVSGVWSGCCQNGCRAVCQTSVKLSRLGRRMSPTHRNRQAAYALSKPRFTKWESVGAFVAAAAGTPPELRTG